MTFDNGTQEQDGCTTLVVSVCATVVFSALRSGKDCPERKETAKWAH